MQKETTVWQCGELWPPSKHVLSCIPGRGTPFCLHALMLQKKLVLFCSICMRVADPRVWSSHQSGEADDTVLYISGFCAQCIIWIFVSLIVNVTFFIPKYLYRCKTSGVSFILCDFLSATYPPLSHFWTLKIQIRDPNLNKILEPVF